MDLTAPLLAQIGDAFPMLAIERAEMLAGGQNNRVVRINGELISVSHASPQPRRDFAPKSPSLTRSRRTSPPPSRARSTVPSRPRRASCPSSATAPYRVSHWDRTRSRLSALRRGRDSRARSGASCANCTGSRPQRWARSCRVMASPLPHGGTSGARCTPACARSSCRAWRRMRRARIDGAFAALLVHAPRRPLSPLSTAISDRATGSATAQLAR